MTFETLQLCLVITSPVPINQGTKGAPVTGLPDRQSLTFAFG